MAAPGLASWWGGAATAGLITRKNRLQPGRLKPKPRYFNTIAGIFDIVPSMGMTEQTLSSILGAARVIAVVGASPNPGRPSHQVARYLIEHGFDVVPVRPKVKEILGRKCYGSLEEIPVRVDIVDVFRKPEACPDVARSAVAVGANVLWLQEGIISEEAARIAREGGLEVVMDACIKKVHQQLKI